MGPLTIHFYAIAILTGIAVAIYWGNARFVAAGGAPGRVSEIAIVAVPMGVIGGRIYHVISSPNAYFGAGGQPVDAFKIWEGGLGIWGAISIGLLGAYLRYRSLARTLELPSFAVFADALAPGILFAQAIGRFGNWFNGELFGRPTSLFWALEIPIDNRPIGYESFTTFHPTFLYEAIWCFLMAFLIMRLNVFQNLKSSGIIFIFYVMAYSFGRLFIESVRIDEANLILGLRLNIWVSVFMFLGACGLFFRKNSVNPSKL